MKLKHLIKQALSLVLAIMMITTSVPVLAITATEATLSISDVKAVAGQTVSVNISVENNPGIATAIFTVTYNNDAMTLNAVELDQEFGGTYTPGPSLNSPVSVTWDSSTDNMNNGNMFKLTFDISDEVDAGEVYDIKISYGVGNICNLDEDDVDFQIDNGTITIVNPLPGDINCDQAVNAKDLTRMRKYFANWEVEVDPIALDCNGDGSINSKDLTRLRKYFADWDVELYYGTITTTKCKHTSLTAVNAKEATATENGNIAYWYCATCNKYFSDSECSNEITLEDTVIKYTSLKVVFQDYDGTILSTQYVEAGDAANAPDNPTRSGYEFVGWDKTFESIISDTVVTAKYVAVEAPTFVVDCVTAKAGETGVEVSISLENNPGIASMLFNIEYDAKKFTLTDLTYNDELGGDYIGLEPGIPTDSPACAYWSMHINDMTKDIVFVTLTFDVAADIVGGEYPITISYDIENVYNKNEENVHFEIINGKIIVE